MSSDKEDGEKATSNGSPINDKNGSDVVACDSNNEIDDNPQLPKEDDYATPTFASDELRPMKKVKPCADEDCHPEELDNGWFIFYGKYYCLHLILFIQDTCNLPG